MLTDELKTQIANKIKDITLDDLEEDMAKLIQIGADAYTTSSRSRIGNNVVDYFTFRQRLETKGKYDINFFEFIQNIDKFKKKKFIQTMLTYYKDVKNKNNTKNEYIVLKEVYNICISAINIMRPLNCMEIYTKYKAKRVLNFDAYYGVEINSDLKQPYDNMITFLQTKCATKFENIISDAVDVDYSNMNYDTVFSSPPYYFLEKYANNVKYSSKKDMDEKFYRPLFAKTHNGLQPGGHYIINVCKEVYDNVLKGLLGDAHESFPLKKSKRQNNHTEMVYVWVKK